MLISEEELNKRASGVEGCRRLPDPASQTPWQEMQRAQVSQAETGAVLEPAEVSAARADVRRAAA